MTDFTLFILPIAFLFCGFILVTYIFCCNWYQKSEFRRLNFRYCLCLSPQNNDPFEKEDDLPRYDELSLHMGEDLEDNPPSYEEAMQNMTAGSILHSFQEQVTTVLQRLAIRIKGTPDVITRSEPKI